MKKIDENKIIKECINSVIRDKKMLKEYKSPKCCEVIGSCIGQLQELHDEIVNSGISKREITVEDLQKAIEMLKKVYKMMQP